MRAAHSERDSLISLETWWAKEMPAPEPLTWVRGHRDGDPVGPEGPERLKGIEQIAELLVLPPQSFLIIEPQDGTRWYTQAWHNDGGYDVECAFVSEQGRVENYAMLAPFHAPLTLEAAFAVMAQFSCTQELAVGYQHRLRHFGR